MMFPANGNTFIPEATGMVWAPETDEDWQFLFGAGWQEAKAIAERFKDHPPKYVQIVRTPDARRAGQ